MDSVGHHIVFVEWRLSIEQYNIPQDMNIYFVLIEVRVVRSANAFIDSKNTVRLDTDIYIYWVFVGRTLLEASQFKFAFWKEICVEADSWT
jgi:hypothetical protein